MFLVLSQAANSQNFVEGTHYSLVSNTGKPHDKKEVVEYFSFSCPGCYALEPHITNVLRSLPSIKLRRVHMPFGGRNAKLSQKAFVLMSLLKASEHKDAVFARIHGDKNVFDNHEELVQFFEGLGYGRTGIEETLKSFSADTMLRKMNKEGREQQITSVPTLIVNGKYKINTRAIYSGAALSALIQYLDAKP